MRRRFQGCRRGTRTAPACNGKWDRIVKYQIGAMSVGDILDRGLKLLLARLPAFYTINLIVFAPTLVLQLLLPLLQEQSEPASPAQALTALGGLLLLIVLMLILQPLGTAAILHIIAREFVDEQASVGDAFRFALPRFGRLLGASILAGLTIGLGMLLCLVPGILFAIWYVFVGQVVVVENRGAVDALTRSKQLGEGFRGRIFGMFCLFLLMGLVLGSAANLLNLILPNHEEVSTPAGIRAVLNYRNYAF